MFLSTTVIVGQMVLALDGKPLFRCNYVRWRGPCLYQSLYDRKEHMWRLKVEESGAKK